MATFITSSLSDFLDQVLVEQTDVDTISYAVLRYKYTFLRLCLRNSMFDNMFGD